MGSDRRRRHDLGATWLQLLTLGYPVTLDIARLVRDYGDPAAEARACRTDCALFDFSFMARGRIRGPDAAAVLERFQSRPVADMKAGTIRYAFRLGLDGAIEADITIWRHADGSFELMSGRRADIAALADAATPGATCTDMTDKTAILAVQGPRALEALAPIGDVETLAAIPYFGHVWTALAGVTCIVGRLGYTGERGFEIVADRNDAEALRRAVSTRARPAGFAAADILRIEAGFILFVNECRLRPTASALGLEAFAPQAATPSRIRLVSFTAAHAAVPSPWQPSPGLRPPHAQGEIAITSVCESIVLGQPLGLGFVRMEDAQPAREVHDTAGRFAGLQLTHRPPYDPCKKRPRGPWHRHASPP